MPVYDAQTTRENAAPLVPVQISDEIIKEAPAASQVLSRARKLRNMTSKESRMPVLSSLPLAYFVSGDTGLKQTTKVEWENVAIVAEELAVIVPIAENLIDDSSVPIWSEVKPLINEALGVAIDNAVLFGTDKPSTWPEAIWTQAIAKNHAVDVPAANPDFYKLLLEKDGLFAKVEEDGYGVDGIISHLSMKASLRGVRDTSGRPIFVDDMKSATPYAIGGAPVSFPDNGVMSDPAKLMILGAWNKLVYAIRKDITWKFLDQATISDADGKVIYNFAQNDMVGMRVVMRLGFAMPNPVSRIKPRAQRYPFAVLKTA